MINVCYFADEVSKDFDEAVKLGVEAGANSVEIRGGIWGKSVTTIDDDDVKRMQDTLVKYDAKVTCIGSPFGKCHYDKQDEYETHLRYFDRMVELAHTFNTRIIRGFAFWKPRESGGDANRPNIEDYLDIIAPKLEPAVKVAEREDVTLSFETEGSTLIGTCQEAKAVIDALGNSPALSVCWDVLNGLHCGELPYPDGYNYIKGLVTHFHVKPNSDKNMQTVGSTEIIYEQLFKIAMADGFKGSVSIEHWGRPELMLKGVRELRDVVDKV